jgi:hypothetical protein
MRAGCAGVAAGGRKAGIGCMHCRYCSGCSTPRPTEAASRSPPRRRVHLRLSRDPLVGAAGITVRDIDGNVALSGAMPGYLQNR